MTETELKTTTLIRSAIRRLPRHRCQRCGKRRVLFQMSVAHTSIETLGLGPPPSLATSDAMCAECAGIR